MSSKSSQAFILTSVLLSGVISAVILLYYHNHYWLAADDGFFVHIAQRINQGETYGSDIWVHHPGYHAYLNALLLRIFGDEIAVLRYPIIVLGILQSMLAAYIMRHKGFLISLLAGIATTAIGFIQYLNPSPNWYTLFFAIVCVFILLEFKISTITYLILGLIIGLCAGFRHPSGIFLGFGVTVYLFQKLSEDKNNLAQEKRDTILYYICMAFIILSLLFYHYIFKTGLIGLIFIGIPPILILCRQVCSFQLSNKSILNVVGILALGFFIAFLPLVLWHLDNFGDWVESALLRADNVFNTGGRSDYRLYSVPGLYLYLAYYLGSFDLWSMAIFSILCMSIYVTAISIVYYNCISEKNFDGMNPAIIIGSFYNYIFLYFQVPIYLFFVFPLSLIGILLLADFHQNKAKLSALVLILFALSTFGIFFEAARPLDFSKKESKNMGLRPYGASLYLPEEEEKIYTDTIEFIKNNTSSEDTIFVFPNSPEIYFLSDRKNPTPCIVTPICLHNERDYQRILKAVTDAKPKLIIVKFADKYYDHYEKRLMSIITDQMHYKLVAGNIYFSIYRQEQP